MSMDADVTDAVGLMLTTLGGTVYDSRIHLKCTSLRPLFPDLRDSSTTAMTDLNDL